MKEQLLNPSLVPGIDLTIATGTKDHPNGGTVRVHASELIAYDQQIGFTRLMLVGRRILNVMEGTDQIDRLMRTATARAFSI